MSKDAVELLPAVELPQQSTLAKAEREANEFAAEFLLPTNAVRSHFRLHEPSIANISSIAQSFETSLTATARRFIDLSDEPLALLWQQDGRVEWFHKRRHTFPFFLEVDVLPANSSMAGRLFSGKMVPDDFEPVDPALWLSQRDAERVTRLLEHSIHLPNYGAVLSMIWVEKWDQDLGDDEDELLKDLDPTSFTPGRSSWPR